MANRRPELSGNAGPKDYCPKGGTAYLLIYEAVKTAPGLIHGKLHAHGESCAIGRFFDIHRVHTALESALIDEVAAVNDANPSMSMQQRRKFVLRWLRWKLAQLGMPTTGRPARQP